MSGNAPIDRLHDSRVTALLERMRMLTAPDALVDVSAASRELVFDLLEEVDAAQTLTRTIAGLNDVLSQRVLDSIVAGHDLNGIRLAWMALGSEGRREQTVYTDQDNALIFEADDVHAARAQLLSFADEVNQLLDRCGFPLCRGGVMARNPKWCLSAGEWREHFAGWIDTGDPQALLHGAIFFDFRGLWGEVSLVDELRAWLFDYIAPRPVFLRQMSQNALTTQLPLDWRGHLKFESHAPAGKSFDIKLHGAGPFTDAARVLSLSRGVAAQGTAERLLGWAATDHERREAASWVEAFHALQGYRLRRQRDCHRAGRDLDNRILADSLTDFDRHVLMACFDELKHLRRRMAVDYGLGF